MPPRRPSSSRANVDVPADGAPAAEATQLKPSPYARPNPESAEDEDYSAPMSAEYPMVEGDGSDYGETPRRGEETRVAAIDTSEPEEESPASQDEDDDANATRAGPPVTLEIVDGPDKGKRKRFKGVRMVLGRAKGIDVELSDQSVSRRHVELVMGEGGVLLRDLGSGNGTKVNDERVDERPLQHGDVIAIGKTRIRLVDEQKQIEELRAAVEAKEAEAKKKKEEAAAAAKKATAARGSDVDPDDPRLNEATVARYVVPASLQDGGKGGARPRPVRSVLAERTAGVPKVKLIAMGVFGLVVLMLLGLILAVGRTEPEAPPPDPKLAKAAGLMQQALNAARSDDFAKAVELAEQAERIVPGSDKDGLAKGARVELSIQEGLKEVQALMDAGNFDEARAKLKALPNGTAKSSDAMKKLLTDLEEKEVTALTQKVVELIEQQRDPAAARDAIAKLPIVKQGAYLGRVAELEQELAHESVEEAKQIRVTKAVSAKRAKAAREEAIAEAFSDVERKFHGGDYRAAVLACDRVMDAHKSDKDIRTRALTLKKLIPQFQLNIEDGQRKFNSNSLEASVKPLRKAADLYKQIGFGGSLGDTINEQLASASLAAGKDALKRNDVSTAARSFREALRLNPSDSRAKAGLDSLQSKIEELYLQGYVLKDRDPKAAAEKFELVIESAAEGSEVKQKAETQLSLLKP